MDLQVEVVDVGHCALHNPLLLLLQLLAHLLSVLPLQLQLNIGGFFVGSPLRLLLAGEVLLKCVRYLSLGDGTKHILTEILEISNVLLTHFLDMVEGISLLRPSAFPFEFEIWRDDFFFVG